MNKKHTRLLLSVIIISCTHNNYAGSTLSLDLTDPRSPSLKRKKWKKETITTGQPLFIQTEQMNEEQIEACYERIKEAELDFKIPVDGPCSCLTAIGAFFRMGYNIGELQRLRTEKQRLKKDL